MSKIEIYGFAPSTYTQTAILVAREVGAEFEVRPLEFKQASHLALHPYGKMPAMKHSHVSLHETLALTVYLDEAVGKGGLVPLKPIDKARMFQMISVAIDYAYDSLVSPLHDEISSSDKKRAAEQLKLLDVELEKRQYFAGDAVSLADFFLLPMVEFALEKLGEVEPAGTPHLTKWRDLMGKRKSVQSLHEPEAA